MESLWLAVLEPLSSDIRTGVYFLTGLDAKCVIKQKFLPESAPFFVPNGIPT